MDVREGATLSFIIRIWIEETTRKPVTSGGVATSRTFRAANGSISRTFPRLSRSSPPMWERLSALLPMGTVKYGASDRGSAFPTLASRPLKLQPAAAMSQFIDQALMELHDPAQFTQLLTPASDPTHTLLQTLVAAVYDQPFATVHDARDPQVLSTEMALPLFSPRLTHGTWTQTSPTYTRTDVAYESQQRLEPVWLDLVVQLEVTLVLEVDTGQVQSLLMRDVDDITSLAGFRSRFRFFDVDRFLAEEGITRSSNCGRGQLPGRRHHPATASAVRSHGTRQSAPLSATGGRTDPRCDRPDGDAARRQAGADCGKAQSGRSPRRSILRTSSHPMRRSLRHLSPGGARQLYGRRPASVFRCRTHPGSGDHACVRRHLASRLSRRAQPEEEPMPDKGSPADASTPDAKETGTPPATVPLVTPPPVPQANQLDNVQREALRRRLRERFH